jgi:hypothetical protein
MPEPVAPDLAAEFEQLQKDAAEIDAAANAEVEVPEPPKEAAKKAPAKQPEKEEPKEPETEESQPTLDEEEPGDEEEPVVSKDQERKQKENERYDRSWKRLEAEKAEVRKLKRELEEAQKVFKKKADPAETFKDEKGYSAQQYDEYAEQCEGREDFRSAMMARQRAQEVRGQAMQNMFAERWRETQDDVMAEHEDMQNMLSPLFREVDGLIRNDAIFRSVPEGMRYAVEFAKAKLSSKQLQALQADNDKLNKEITRLNGLLGINGGGTHRSSKPKTFNDMSSEEQFKHLLDQAAELDRAG